jgi:hypothetical protein
MVPGLNFFLVANVFTRQEDAHCTSEWMTCGYKSKW